MLEAQCSVGERCAGFRAIGSQDIEGRAGRRRRRHGARGRAAGAATTVCGGRGAARSPTALATLPTLFRCTSTVPGETKATTSATYKSATRTAQRRLQRGRRKQ